MSIYLSTFDSKPSTQKPGSNRFYRNIPLCGITVFPYPPFVTGSPLMTSHWLPSKWSVNGFIDLVRGAVVKWLAYPLGTPSFGIRSTDHACYILGVGDCVSLEECGCSVVGVLLRNMSKFVYHTLPVSFG